MAAQFEALIGWLIGLTISGTDYVAKTDGVHKTSTDLCS